MDGKKIVLKRKGRRASTEEVHYRDKGRELISSGPDLMDKVARDILTSVVLLTGLYTAAISLKDLHQVGSHWLYILIISPILLFLAGFVFAFWALFPRYTTIVEDAPADIKKKIIDITKRKRRRLVVSASCIGIGIVIIVVNLFFYRFVIGI